MGLIGRKLRPLERCAAFRALLGTDNLRKPVLLLVVFIAADGDAGNPVETRALGR